MFNKRRQSRDRVLIKELIDSTVGKIYIGEYSRLLFEPYPDRVKICKDPAKECADGGICFIENTPIKPYLKDAERFIIYNWNKKYPYDVEVGFDVENEGFKKVAESEFVGSSHEKITKGVYER